VRPLLTQVKTTVISAERPQHNHRANEIFLSFGWQVFSHFFSSVVSQSLSWT